MNLEVGKTYDLTHTRKGSFVFEVVRESGEWVDGVVRGGKTKAMNSYNVCEKDESVTLRKSFIVRAEAL